MDKLAAMAQTFAVKHLVDCACGRLFPAGADRPRAAESFGRLAPTYETWSMTRGQCNRLIQKEQFPLNFGGSSLHGDAPYIRSYRSARPCRPNAC